MGDVSLLAALPFVLMLSSIAAMPLLAGRWWHRHQASNVFGEHRNMALLTAGLALPTVLYLMTVPGGFDALTHEVQGYFSFILFLGTLYILSGGVVMHGSLSPSAGTNAALMVAGALLANVIGTTGASMLLIRPILRINERRVRRAHVPVFFIFIVSNTGGLLTPLGDPPLFLGFVKGVSFFWTLSLWPQWLLLNSLLIVAFSLLDHRLGREFRTDVEELPRVVSMPLHLDGWRLNGGLLLVVAAAVIGKKYLPFPVPELVMAACAIASVKWTPRDLRITNQFTWAPIVEVAILFAGIFITMVPALALLESNRERLGLAQPWQFFWVTGLLSSVLDNAPTYLSIATLAAEGRGLGALATEHPEVLAAISCGAVFMGANSYIGNGPNFMVKAIAEETGYHMPSFFRYMLNAAVTLGPLYVLLTFVFFWR